MAGFIFRPRWEGDDTVFCPYCSLSIDAWEKDDDPRKTHEELGSGNCLFLQHTANISISAAKEEINTTEPTAAEEVEEKSGSKRRASRARKAPINQRKKAAPRSKPDHDDQHEPVSKGGNAEDDAKGSKKPTRGKKRGSAAMEEGGKKLLFPNKEENVMKAVDGQQLPPEGQEAQKPRPTKRRVTRASMANQPSTSNLVVSVPDHLAHGDNDDVGSASFQNIPIKPKPKEKKKATRPSTAAAKPGKAEKKVTSKTPLNVPRPSDEEIDRKLEREIMEGFEGLDDNSVKVEANASVPDPEVEDLHDSNELTESDVIQPPAKKTTRRLTRTKPASRRSPSPAPTTVLEDQEHTQPKPRRKGLTRTKPQPSDLTHTQSEAGDVTGLEDPDDIEPAAEALPTPRNVSNEATPAGGAESNDRPPLDHPAQTSTPKQGEVVPADLESEPIPKVPEPAPPVESTSVEAAIEATSVIKETDHSPQDDNQNSQKTSSAQLVATRSTSISPTKDKDMKRKSDVVTDDGQDRRTSKKRKTVKAVKAAKPQASSKKETGVSVHSEKSQKNQKPDKPEVQPSVPPRQESTSSTATSKESVAQVEVPIGHEDSTVEEQETIIDDFGDNHDIGAEEARSAIIQGSTSEDNTIDVILNGYARPQGASPQKKAQAEAPPTSKADKSPSSPSMLSDIGSRDSIPNTQFSMPASQMTVATSFQGSIKDVSFVRSAEGSVQVEPNVSPIEDIREQSIIVSPKQSRTPLSVLSKSHNGALALMTPRNRAEDVTFAPVQSQKPWKSTDVELYIDGLKENQEIEPQSKGLSESERDMTVAEWIMDVSKRAEKQLVQKGELLVRFFEDEAERAVAAIEAIETE